ncbi:MAG: prepilin-type N-terminal cleavage/methylation domain-containing protein [Clostridiales bacterium]|nr:prepilin-type N-terminal cleavage/methylation domain-containing protein [Clostridiales bacterium]
MLEMKRNIKGFTLAELLVVVAIIAVLVAVSIPVFTSQLDKARRTTCEANRTTLRHHIIVDYLSGNITSINDAALKKYIDKDETRCPSGGTYTVSGNLADGTFKIVWSKQSGGELDDFAALASKVEDELTGGEKWHSGDDLIAKVIEANNGKLVSVSTSSLFGDSALKTSDTTLYWRPKVVESNGKKVVFLYANTGNSGTAGWKGYAGYYNGSYYVSTKKTYGGKIDETSVPTAKTIDTTLDQWLTDNNYKLK